MIAPLDGDARHLRPIVEPRPQRAQVLEMGVIRTAPSGSPVTSDGSRHFAVPKRTWHACVCYAEIRPAEGSLGSTAERANTRRARSRVIEYT